MGDRDLVGLGFSGRPGAWGGAGPCGSPGSGRLGPVLLATPSWPEPYSAFLEKQKSATGKAAWQPGGTELLEGGDCPCGGRVTASCCWTGLTGRASHLPHGGRAWVPEPAVTPGGKQESGEEAERTRRAERCTSRGARSPRGGRGDSDTAWRWEEPSGLRFRKASSQPGSWLLQGTPNSLPPAGSPLHPHPHHRHRAPCRDTWF